MNWNKWVRQTHRWLSIAFTLGVIVNFVAVGQKKYTVWVGLLALLPLAVLLFTGSVLVRAAVCPEVGQRATHRFFAIIEVAMPAEGKKRDWFDLGAAAYAQACPGTYAAPTYVCPVCRNPFTVEALAGHRLR